MKLSSQQQLHFFTPPISRYNYCSIFITIAVYQVVITKRLLSQLYGRGEGGMEKLTDESLARKETLCRDLLVTVSKIDPGFSQFRGLTTWELFLTRNEQKRRSTEMKAR